eukprot:355211-Chlamydomonas_euryale.AAC.6
MADLLPGIEVVENDPFNSDPYDPKLMGPDALARFRAGEKLPAVKAKTPLVRCAGCARKWCAGVKGGPVSCGLRSCQKQFDGVA